MPLDFVRYTPEIETITARELDVPRLIRDGHRYKQIAKKLGIAETTVSFHIQNLVQKLGANDKTHAVGHGADRDPQEGVRLCRELVAGPFLQAAQDFTVDEPWHQYPIVAACCPSPYLEAQVYEKGDSNDYPNFNEDRTRTAASCSFDSRIWRPNIRSRYRQV